MKRNQMILAALLACAMLGGCASRTVPNEPYATPEAAPTQQAPAEIAAVTEDMEVPTEAIPELPSEQNVSDFVVEIIPVITGAQNQVTVTTVDEFLAAIAPDTEIIVNAELIDLSKASGYGSAKGEYYYWYKAFDGPELYISGVSNLTIRGSSEDHNANVISAVPRYANVLTFENCSNIMVKGLTAGHTEEPGSCMGGVLCFWNSQDILIENCGLFGCGTLGVNAYSSKNMQIVNNDIYDCSVGGVEFSNCDAVNVDGNTFRDLGGPIFRIYDCGTITCNGEDAIPFK